MVLLVNRSSGGPMWVHEDRVEEYLAAGHRLAAAPAPAKPLKPAQAKKKGRTAGTGRKPEGDTSSGPSGHLPLEGKA